MKTVAAILKYKGHQVTTIEPTETVAHIVAVMTELRIGSVLVTDRADRLLGIVSEVEATLHSDDRLIAGAFARAGALLTDCARSFLVPATDHSGLADIPENGDRPFQDPGQDAAIR
jgi:CBS domain